MKWTLFVKRRRFATIHVETKFYYESDKEKYSEYNRSAFKSLDKEKRNKRQRELYALNPEPAKRNARRRRAMKLSISYVSDRDWDRLVIRYRGLCAYCSNPWDSNGGLHQEHVIPVSRGGHGGIGNVLPVCAKCSSEKGSKLLSEWKLWRKKMLLKI